MSFFCSVEDRDSLGGHRYRNYMKKKLYQIIVEPGTKMQEIIYADSFKYNKKNDTYTYHVIIKRKILKKKK